MKFRWMDETNKQGDRQSILICDPTTKPHLNQETITFSVYFSGASSQKPKKQKMPQKFSIIIMRKIIKKIQFICWFLFTTFQIKSLKCNE